MYSIKKTKGKFNPANAVSSPRNALCIGEFGRRIMQFTLKIGVIFGIGILRCFFFGGRNAFFETLMCFAKLALLPIFTAFLRNAFKRTSDF